jgi:hypothetical protein
VSRQCQERVQKVEITGTVSGKFIRLLKNGTASSRNRQTRLSPSIASLHETLMSSDIRAVTSGFASTPEHKHENNRPRKVTNHAIFQSRLVHVHHRSQYEHNGTDAHSLEAREQKRQTNTQCVKRRFRWCSPSPCGAVFEGGGVVFVVKVWQRAGFDIFAQLESGRRRA